MADIPDYNSWKKSNYGAKEVFEWPLTFHFRGTYDYDGLMKLIRSYYYKVRFEKIIEPKLKYKVSGGKAEVEFKFESEMKVSLYTKVHLFVTGHMWGVERGKPTTGKLEITIQTKYEYDYNGKFDVSKPIQRWMLKRIHQPSIAKGMSFGDLKLEGKKNAKTMADNLLAEIKTFIGVECV